MIRPFRVLAAIAIAATVAACSSTAPAASSPPSESMAVTSEPATPQPATAAPSDTPVASAMESSAASVLSATAVPTSLDPCQLVTAQEASALAGATYTTGKEETTSGHSKICWYGSNTLNVFEVVVAQGPDAATVQAEKTAVLSQLDQAAGSGIKTTMLTGVGDEAAFLSMSETIAGQTLNGSGIYVLKGLVFFAIVDLVSGKPSPTSAAMQAQAQTTLSRIP